jgi:hypothetical protein
MMNIAGACRGIIVMICTTDAAGIRAVAVVDSSRLKIMREESQTYRRRSTYIVGTIAIVGMSLFFILTFLASPPAPVRYAQDRPISRKAAEAKCGNPSHFHGVSRADAVRPPHHRKVIDREKRDATRADHLETGENP